MKSSLWSSSFATVCHFHVYLLRVQVFLFGEHSRTHVTLFSVQSSPSIEGCCRWPQSTLLSSHADQCKCICSLALSPTAADIISSCITERPSTVPPVSVDSFYIICTQFLISISFTRSSFSSSSSTGSQFSLWPSTVPVTPLTKESFSLLQSSPASCRSSGRWARPWTRWSSS